MIRHRAAAADPWGRGGDMRHPVPVWCGVGRFRAAILLVPVGIRVLFWAYRGLASGYGFEPGEGLLLFAGFLAWMLGPYLLLERLARRFPDPPALVAAAVAMLSVESLAHFQVFVFPGTPADGLLFIVLPVIQALVVMPAGLAFGAVAGRLAPVHRHGPREAR